MRFFTRIAILFYVVTISTLGALIIASVFVLDQAFLDKIDYYLQLLASDIQLKTIVGLTGLLFILLSLIFARIISGARQKERTIAFDNPSGPVCLSFVSI